MQPEFISRISMPASFKKPPSIPICPNSFSIRTTFSPEIASFKSCLINVVFPAPRKPEIISIFVILLTFFSVQMCTDCKSLSARYLSSRQCITLHRLNLPKFRSATYYFTQIPSKVKHLQSFLTFQAVLRLLFLGRHFWNRKCRKKPWWQQEFAVFKCEATANSF